MSNNEFRISKCNAKSLSENSEGSRAWGLHGERKARGGGDAADIVDDELRRDRRATPMRPSGAGETPTLLATNSRNSRVLFVLTHHG
jgi:hypothetical protein